MIRASIQSESKLFGGSICSHSDSDQHPDWVLFQVESRKELGDWPREVVLLCFGVFLLSCVLMVVAAILTVRLFRILSALSL